MRDLIVHNNLNNSYYCNHLFMKNIGVSRYIRLLPDHTCKKNYMLYVQRKKNAKEIECTYNGGIKKETRRKTK